MERVLKPDVKKLEPQNKVINKIVTSGINKKQLVAKSTKFVDLLKLYKELDAKHKEQFHSYVENLPEIDSWLNKMKEISHNSDDCEIYCITEDWQDFLQYDFGNSLSKKGNARAQTIIKGDSLLEQMTCLQRGYTTIETMRNLVEIYFLQNKDETVIDGRTVRSDDFLDSAFSKFYQELQEEDKKHNENKKGQKKKIFDPEEFSKLRIKEIASKGLVPLEEELDDETLQSVKNEQQLVSETLDVVRSQAKKK